MGDLLVLLDRRGITVRAEGGVLRVEQADRPARRIPIGLIGCVVVHGSPLVACNVWRKLADARVPACLFPGRGREGAALLGLGLSGGVEARLAQHRVLADPARRLEAARRVVLWKTGVQMALLENLRGRDDRDLRARAQGLVRCRDMALEATDADRLRGAEGQAARLWFGGLRAQVPSRWKFQERNRRPPRDPVNAMLSLSYTLALAEAGRAVALRGLDPCVGFLHGPRPGRDSLCLDILEPLRPAVDMFVLGLAREEMRPGWFTTSGNQGCRLNRQGRSVFYQAWAKARLCWPPHALAPLEAREHEPSLERVLSLYVEDMVRSWDTRRASGQTTHTMNQ